LIAFMWFLPDGAAGLPRRLRTLLRRREAGEEPRPEREPAAIATESKLPAGKA